MSICDVVPSKLAQLNHYLIHVAAIQEQLLNWSLKLSPYRPYKATKMFRFFFGESQEIKTMKCRIEALEAETASLRSDIASLLKWKAQFSVSLKSSTIDATGEALEGVIVQGQEGEVGDVVERRATDPLNFSSSFLKSKIEILGPNQFLAGQYWWPCQVIQINPANKSYKLHYWGYGEDWDHWVVTETEKMEGVRPRKFAQADIGELKAGDTIEAQIYQNTHIADEHSDDAYCWIAGTVVSCEAGKAVVQLRATGLDTIKIDVSALRRV